MLRFAQGSVPVGRTMRARRGERAIATIVVAAAFALASSVALAVLPKGGAANIAMIGEL